MDYVDRLPDERNLGKFEHDDLRGRIYRALCETAERLRIIPMIATRVQVSATICRLSDVCCIRKRPKSGIITDPPVLCIEILSPMDGFWKMQNKIMAYLAMGVGSVWVIDPDDLDAAYIFQRGAAFVQVTDRVLIAGDVKANLDDLPQSPTDFQ